MSVETTEKELLGLERAFWEALTTTWPPGTNQRAEREAISSLLRAEGSTVPVS
jgi:hypothetical protein